MPFIPHYSEKQKLCLILIYSHKKIYLFSLFFCVFFLNFGDLWNFRYLDILYKEGIADLEAIIEAAGNLCYTIDSDKHFTERLGDFYGYRRIIYGYVVRKDE